MAHHGMAAPAPPAEIYGHVLGHLFQGRLNFDPSIDLGLGDFGVIENGEFSALINLIVPSEEQEERLRTDFPDFPDFPAMVSPKPLGRVGAGSREFFRQGIVAVGATLHTRTGEIASDAMQPVEGPVTVKIHQLQAAMLSLENQERRPIRLSESSIVKAHRFLNHEASLSPMSGLAPHHMCFQNRRRILQAFDRPPTSKCFFVSQIDTCYGYCNSLQLETPEVEAEIVVDHGLPYTLAAKVSGGLLHNSGKQECAIENKKWKYVFRYRGHQWVGFEHSSAPDRQRLQDTSAASENRADEVNSTQSGVSDLISFDEPF